MKNETNIFKQVYIFFCDRLQEINEAVRALRNAEKDDPERKDTITQLIKNTVVVLGMLTIVGAVLYYVWEKAISPVYEMWVKLPEPVHIIVKFLLVMAVIAMIARYFRKEPEDDDADPEGREAIEVSKQHRSYLHANVQTTAPISGLRTSLHESDLTSDGVLPYIRHQNGKTNLYPYIELKDPHFDKPINLAQIRENLQLKFRQMERNGEIPGVNPEGFFWNRRVYCNILVMKVIDRGTYVEICLSRASSHSCRIYNKKNYFEDDFSDEEDDKDF